LGELSWRFYLRHPDVAGAVTHGENQLVGGNSRSEGDLSEFVPCAVEVRDIKWGSHGTLGGRVKVHWKPSRLDRKYKMDASVDVSDLLPSH